MFHIILFQKCFSINCILSALWKESFQQTPDCINQGPWDQNKRTSHLSPDASEREGELFVCLIMPGFTVRYSKLLFCNNLGEVSWYIWSSRKIPGINSALFCLDLRLYGMSLGSSADLFFPSCKDFGVWFGKDMFIKQRDCKFLSETHSKRQLMKDDVTKQMRAKVVQIGENIVSIAFSSDFFGYKSFTDIKCQQNPFINTT